MKNINFKRYSVKTLKQLAKMKEADRRSMFQSLADAALFLASEESSYITGGNVLVDGGLTAAYVTPE